MPAEEERFGSLAYRAARTVYPDGREEASRAALLAEHTLEISLDGKPWKRVVCTRSDLRAMLVGQLYTAGRIASPGDVLEMRFSRDV